MKKRKRYCSCCTQEDENEGVIRMVRSENHRQVDFGGPSPLREICALLFGLLQNLSAIAVSIEYDILTCQR